MPSRRVLIKGLWIIAGLLTLGIGGTVLMDFTNADISWTSKRYIEGGGSGGWIYGRTFPWNILYDYGELPAWGLGVGAAVGLILVGVGRLRAAYARPCLAVVLTIVIGPGLLVNGIFKNCWGRPRPADVVSFGGGESFRSVSEPAGPGGGRSFPCGHCAMAFATSSGVAFYTLHPVASLCTLFGGLAFGIVMGVSRVSQGGHFPTDVLWSGIMVMLVIAALYYLVLKIPESDS